jgi:hypothetical protein
MAYALSPAYVQFYYHSPFGQHVQTVPTTSYSPSSGEFTTHAGGGIAAIDMVTNLMLVMKKFYGAGVIYDNCRIFTKFDALTDPVFRGVITFVSSNEGDFATPGTTQAVQGTFSYLGVGGTKGRLTFLDCASGDSFVPQFATGGSGILFNLMAEISDLDNGWSTRGNERPETFLQYSKTLNEKLRREYRMF